MEETNYITEEKKKSLQEELNHLKTTKRKEILEALEVARALGDLSEMLSIIKLEKIKEKQKTELFKLITC